MHQSMKPYNCIFPLSDGKRRCLCSLFISVSLICGVYFIGSAWLRKDLWREPSLPVEVNTTKVLKEPSLPVEVNTTKETAHIRKCNGECRLIGSEALPEGIISRTSNLQVHSLWGHVSEHDKSNRATGLLAIAVGINQKRLVDQIVKKFLSNDFSVMLFHYDGVVDEWHDMEWSNSVVHISVSNQTKWWFAKRFLHPDIVAVYDYIFVWDEDLIVDNFHPERYLSIIKEEGLEISQPALDHGKSEVHHPITVRRQGSRVHRRFYKYKGSGRCDEHSTAPPCVGWVEMMAPVFSKAAWRCAWYLIQNDLIHAWGLDMQLGYCAQGDRTLKVGVVDEEYIVHLGLPTLGGISYKNKTNNSELADQSSHSNKTGDPGPLVDVIYRYDNRSAVRQRSYKEMGIFRKRWDEAVKKDECWVDPFKRNEIK